MAYPWILYGALKSPAPAMYGIISVNRILVAVVLTTAALPHATAQQPSPAKEISHNYVFRYDPYPIHFNISSAMKLILAILIFAMFFVFFFSMYYRQLFDDEAAFLGADPRISAFVNHRRPQQRFPRGLDASVVESFPVLVYSEVKGVKIGNEALECAICISEFEDDENLRLLPKCHHVFHPDCIDAWLASHTTCPVCRANLAPEKGESEQITDPIHSQENRSGAPEPVQTQNQVAIDVEPEEITRNSQPPVTAATDATATAVSKFPRSHSTGHSLVRPGENCERYTLRLPEDIQNNIVRAQSCDVVLRLEGSSRRGWRNSGGGGSGGDGSNRGRRGSDRWMFTMTPPFISKTGSIGKGDLEQSSSTTCYPI